MHYAVCKLLKRAKEVKEVLPKITKAGTRFLGRGSYPPPHQPGVCGMCERCKLSQQGPGQSPVRTLNDFPVF